MDLRLLATELVANAVRHTGVEDGSVEIELRIAPHTVHLTVIDDGPGFELPRRPIVERPRAPAAGACTSSTSARPAGAPSAPIATACGWSWPVAEITSEPLGPGTAVVAVTGEVTFSNVARLDREIDHVLTDATQPRRRPHRRDVHRLVRALDAADRVFAGARARGGTVALVLAQDEPPSIFRFRGVDRLLALYPSREAALAGLS